jgi:hypothetical protein
MQIEYTTIMAASQPFSTSKPEHILNIITYEAEPPPDISMDIEYNMRDILSSLQNSRGLRATDGAESTYLSSFQGIIERAVAEIMDQMNSLQQGLQGGDWKEVFGMNSDSSCKRNQLTNY